MRVRTETRDSMTIHKSFHGIALRNKYVQTYDYFSFKQPFCLCNKSFARDQYVVLLRYIGRTASRPGCLDEEWACV